MYHRLPKSLFLVVMFFASHNALAQSNELTTFILVRHAEKMVDSSDDPDLKPEGVERAGRLAALLGNASVDVILSTGFKRTKNTVAPLASQKGLTVDVYSAAKPEVVEGWMQKYKGKTIVVAGHSNTIPQIANALLGSDVFQSFADTDYGNILIITVLKKGDGKVTRLNY